VTWEASGGPLTDRERDALRLAGQGLSNKERLPPRAVTRNGSQLPARCRSKTRRGQPYRSRADRSGERASGEPARAKALIEEIREERDRLRAELAAAQESEPRRRWRWWR